MAIATTNFTLCKYNNIRERGQFGAFFKVWRCRECTFTWVDRRDLARPEKELYRCFYLTPTWISTSYMGTSVVPYAPNLTVKMLGLAGSLLGKGSILSAEAKPITSTESSKHE
ncbi:hypothetical protein [Microcoleus sp. S13_C5]|uniref:hypothetical protein n=1 Tax=Microcoleus sp. S13_C5 TaxID=3055411 RepID=UPI002FCFBE9C